MIIDIREIPTRWINLEEHQANKAHMTSMLNSLGFKNHARTPGIRVSGYEGNSFHQPINHFMGVGLAQVHAMTKIKDFLPGLILEDDVKTTPDYNPILNIPDDVDAVYLGVSNAGHAFGRNLNNGYARIFHVLAAHAIVYVSPRFIEAVINMAKTCLLENMTPFDVPLSQLLTNYNIITPIRPYFYQSNEKESQNKWEHLTINPLKIYG